MTKKTKLVITTFWILLTRSYDAYCTSQLTPDLSKENKPLVSVLGMTWTPLLLTIGILAIYSIYTYYLTIFKTKNLLPIESGYSLNNIIAFIYLGQKDNWTAILYKFPRDISRFNHYMGHVFTKCLVFVGFVSTIMWILINYTGYYKTFHSPTFIYLFIVFGCVWIIYKWNRKMYKQYLATLMYRKNG